MTKEDFKSLCRDEFGITMFSKPEYFKSIEKVFGIPGRTFMNWIYRYDVPLYFDSAVELYMLNKRLKSDNLKLSEALVQFTERIKKVEEATS